MFKNSVINIEISNDIEKSLEFAQANGFQFIEIQSAWGKNIENLEKDELMILDQMVKDHGLKVSCVSSTLFLRCFLDDSPGYAPEIRGFSASAGDYKLQMKALQRAFQAADILGTSLIRIFGFAKAEEINDDAFTMAAEKLQEPINQAKNAGHILVLENCPHTSFGWGINVARLIKLVDSPILRLLWDPAGSVRAGESDCVQALKDLVQLAEHVHVKDISSVQNNKGNYTTPGKGLVPWETIIRTLIDSEYKGAFSIEPHYLGSNGTKAGAVLESKQAIEDMFARLESND